MNENSKFVNFLTSVKELKIVVLAGAGVSAESGIKTFRDSGGLWDNYSIDEVATPFAFKRNPKLVYSFYNERRKKLLEVEPNNAHYELTRLENLPEIDFFLITQNVDDLHERAGSKNIIHMHGELLKARCVKCGYVVFWRENLDSSNLCEKCSGNLRPHVVWFNELPLNLREIEKKLKACNLFLSIGTSGTVYPAADFYLLAKMRNAFCMEINLKSTNRSFDYSLEGNSSIVMKKLVDEIEHKYVKRIIEFLKDR